MALIRDLLRRKQPDEPLTPHPYKYKTSFSMLGTVGSGKTSIAAALGLTAMTMSAKFPEFRCRILERTSGIRTAISNLRRGRFPPKTDPNQLYPPEAGLLLSWKGRVYGTKSIQIPICDVAGEEIQTMIQKYGRSMRPEAHWFQKLSQVVKYVRDSEGFILAVPASRALIWDDDHKYELEPEDLNVDPDVNLARILEDIFEHKETTGGKKIKAIAVVITKWDLLRPYALQKGMDISTADGLYNFMETCFPDTNMSLKSHGMRNIRFFPSYINVLRDEEGKKVKWKDGGERIKMFESQLRIPEYYEDSYFKLFEFLKSFAT